MIQSVYRVRSYSTWTEVHQMRPSQSNIPNLSLKPAKRKPPSSRSLTSSLLPLPTFHPPPPLQLPPNAASSQNPHHPLKRRHTPPSTTNSPKDNSRKQPPRHRSNHHGDIILVRGNSVEGAEGQGCQTIHFSSSDGTRRPMKRERRYVPDCLDCSIWNAR